MPFSLYGQQINKNNQQNQNQNQNQYRNSGSSYRPGGNDNNFNKQQQGEYQDLSKILQDAANLVNSNRSKNVTGTEMRSQFIDVVKKLNDYAKKLEKNNTQQDNRNALTKAATAIESIYKNRSNEMVTFQLIVFKRDTWNLVAELINELIKKFNLQNLKKAQVRNLEDFKNAAAEINKEKVQQYQQAAEQAVNNNQPPPPPPKAATPAEVEEITGLTTSGANFDVVEEEVGDIVPLVSNLETSFTKLNQEAEDAYMEEVSKQLQENKVTSEDPGRLNPNSPEDDMDVPGIDDSDIQKQIEQDPLLTNKLNKDTGTDASEQVPDTYNVHDTEFYEDLENDPDHAAIWYNRKGLRDIAGDYIQQGINYIAKSKEFSSKLRRYTEESSTVLNTADHLIDEFSKVYGFKSFFSLKGMVGRDKPVYYPKPKDEKETLKNQSQIAYAFVQHKDNILTEEDEFDGVSYSESKFRSQKHNEDDDDYRVMKGIWDRMHKFYVEQEKRASFGDYDEEEVHKKHDDYGLTPFDYSVIHFINNVVPTFLKNIDDAVSGLVGSEAVYILEAKYVGSTINDMVSNINIAMGKAADADKVDTKSELKKYFQKEFGDENNTVYGYIYDIHKFLDQLGEEMRYAINAGNLQVDALEELEEFFGNDSSDISIWDSEIGEQLTESISNIGANRNNIIGKAPQLFNDFINNYQKSNMPDDNFGGIFSDMKSQVIVTALRMFIKDLRSSFPEYTNHRPVMNTQQNYGKLLHLYRSA